MNLRVMGICLLILVASGSPVWAAFCTGCGATVADDARFCGKCGKALPGSAGIDSAAAVPPSATEVPAGQPPVSVAPSGPQSFLVTSRYLLLNGYRIPQNTPFWVAEVSGTRARIWCVNAPPWNGLIMGWVSLAELNKRSTWKTGTVIVCVEPPPPTEIIVIRERPSWWHTHFGFSWSNRHRDRDHHHRH